MFFARNSLLCDGRRAAEGDSDYNKPSKEASGLLLFLIKAFLMAILLA
jgi:hypothetical protein